LQRTIEAIEYTTCGSLTSMSFELIYQVKRNTRT